MLVFVSVSVQNMVAYVMLEDVTFPDTSCFIPRLNAPCWSDFLHSVFVVFKYKVFISDNIFVDTNISLIGQHSLIKSANK